MNLKDKKYHADFEKINRDISITCESLGAMIVNVCKTSEDPKIYKKYADISEKIDKGIKEKEYRSLHSNLMEFIESLQSNEKFKEEKMFGFLVLLLLNVQKLTINYALLDIEKISYCFPNLEKTTDSFLEDVNNYNNTEFLNALESFNENLKINVEVNKNNYLVTVLELTVNAMKHHIDFIKEIKNISIKYEKEYIKNF